MKMILQFILTVIFVICFSLVISVGIFCFTSWLEQKECKEKCYMNDYFCHYSMFTGCMVNNGGRWLEYELANKSK